MLLASCYSVFVLVVHYSTRGCHRGGSSVATPTPSGDDALPSIRARDLSLTASRDTLSCMRSSRSRAWGRNPLSESGAPGDALPGPRSFNGPARPSFASSSITTGATPPPSAFARPPWFVAVIRWPPAVWRRLRR